MTDKEMIERLREQANTKALSSIFMRDMEIPVPQVIADRVGNLAENMANENEKQAGTLALSADYLESGANGELVPGLAVMLRTMADEDVDYAERQESEAQDKEDYIKYGLNDEDDEEDEDEEDPEELRSNAEGAREDAAFFRSVADRLEEKSASN